MTPSYANEKLAAMIEAFALSRDSMQDKLAFGFQGELYKLSDSCFPAYLLPDWQTIIDCLRSASDVSQQRPRMKLADDDARELIQQLLVLSMRLQRRVSVDDYILRGNY